MMALRISAILIAIAILWSFSEANDIPVVDCCMKTSPKRIPLRIVKSYQLQTVGDGCTIQAVIFKTKRGLSLCAPPDQTWVKKLIVMLDSPVTPRRPKGKGKKDKSKGRKKTGTGKRKH
uniref:Chemokine interleukin-8-like domain-containing protein n=1 Tax=Latimeria chalumnae TaxID=7897 RepID=M3XLA1_LATCH|nr:PREDICTED: regakine-1 [Latimeria chalumnae]|eukprot:XP_005999081.1 PREDICTED: regakine-1 [Latimeria chalumnae]